MRRVSDLLVLIIQILLIYLVVHFSNEWNSNQAKIFFISFTIFVSSSIGFKALLDLGNNFAVSPRPPKNSELVSSGIYSKIRNPMYLAIIMITSSFVIAGFSYQSLIAFAVLLVFLHFKMNLEEQYLEEKFSEYKNYKNRTKRLVPKIY